MVQAELPRTHRIRLDEPRHRQEPKAQWQWYDGNADFSIRHSPNGAWTIKSCYRQGASGTKRFHHRETESRTATYRWNQATQGTTGKSCRTRTQTGKIGNTHGQTQKRSHWCCHCHSKRSWFSFRKWKVERTGTSQREFASGSGQAQ